MELQVRVLAAWNRRPVVIWLVSGCMTNTWN